MNGKKVIVRGKDSGVFFGTLAERNGQEVKLTDCRRIWFWSGAASLHQLAKEGVKNPDECRFSVSVDEIFLWKLSAVEQKLQVLST